MVFKGNYASRAKSTFVVDEGTNCESFPTISTEFEFYPFSYKLVLTFNYLLTVSFNFCLRWQQFNIRKRDIHTSGQTDTATLYI